MSSSKSKGLNTHIPRQTLTSMNSHLVVSVFTFQKSANAVVLSNNNNNNIYLLQLGCYPVAVVILHVNKT